MMAKPELAGGRSSSSRRFATGASCAPGFVEAQSRCGYKDGAVGAGCDTDQEGEGKVTQGRLPEEEESGDRDQGARRRVDRTHHHLPDGVVCQLVVPAA